MKLNPLVFVFWTFTTIVGYLAGGQDLTAALTGLAAGLGITLIVELFV